MDKARSNIETQDSLCKSTIFQRGTRNLAWCILHRPTCDSHSYQDLNDRPAVIDLTPLKSILFVALDAVCEEGLLRGLRQIGVKTQGSSHRGLAT